MAIKDASQYFGHKLALTLSIPFAEAIIVSKAKAPPSCGLAAGDTGRKTGAETTQTAAAEGRQKEIL